jgi:hypothetical protein
MGLDAGLLSVALDLAVMPLFQHGWGGHGHLAGGTIELGHET